MPWRLINIQIMRWIGFLVVPSHKIILNEQKNHLSPANIIVFSHIMMSFHPNFIYIHTYICILRSGITNILLPAEQWVLGTGYDTVFNSVSEYSMITGLLILLRFIQTYQKPFHSSLFYIYFTVWIHLKNA